MVLDEDLILGESWKELKELVASKVGAGKKPEEPTRRSKRYAAVAPKKKSYKM
jgi:hypothetical protein